MPMIHLSWSIKASPAVRDLFYCLLYEIDESFPIKPLAKSTDRVDVCNKCHGLVWANCLLGPIELRAAARQVAAVSGEEFVIKVHSWKKGNGCSAWNRVSTPIADTAPEPRSLALVTVN